MTCAKTWIEQDEKPQNDALLTGCVIMASGLGKRFGGNKLMTDLGGQPLLRWALDATEGLFQKRVVVTRHEEVARLCERQGVRSILHDLPHRSDTVRLGLEAVMQSVDGCLFLPGDQPLIRRTTLDSFITEFQRGPDFILRAAFGETAGSPTLFPRRAFPELLELPVGKGGGVVVKRHPEWVRLLSVSSEEELWDVDTPEELERIRGMIQREM